MTAQLERTTDYDATASDRGSTSDDFEEKPRWVNLLALIAIIFALSTISGKVGAVLIVLSILAMVMMHEFGHFITARWAGMKVTDFFVGFGPTIWSIKKGEVRYGVKALPFGGFVRVIGMNSLEEVDPADEDRTYRAKSYWQRVRFAVAGSFSHFALAFILMVVLLWGYGNADPERATTQIQEVSAKLPTGEPGRALAAGLKGGDTIVGINGDKVATWAQVASAINSSPGRQLQITVERDGRRFTTPVTPADARTPKDVRSGAKPTGMIGIQPSVHVERYGLPEATWHAAFELKDLTVDSAVALYGLFHPSGIESYGKQLTQTGPSDPAVDGKNRLLSPVGMFHIADVSAENGFDAVLSLLIGINVFVGIFNMIPLPPFDGGHIAVASYEAIVSKRKGRRHMIDMAKMLPVAYVVIIGMFLLSASALWLDITRPFNFG